MRESASTRNSLSCEPAESSLFQRKPGTLPGSSSAMSMTRSSAALIASPLLDGSLPRRILRNAGNSFRASPGLLMSSL